MHETESLLILNGSRDVNFTMDLVFKDMSLFNALAESLAVPLEIGPLVQRIFADGQTCYGDRCFSPNIVRRLEQACGCELLAPGFPQCHSKLFFLDVSSCNHSLKKSA